MNAQDKIQQLAMAALRSAPAPTGVPKPATFMAAPEKLRQAIPATASEQEVKSEPATPAAAPAPVPAVAAAPETPAFKDEGCPELRAMIEERDAVKDKKNKRTSLAVTLALLAMLGSAGGWFAVNPEAQAKVARIVPLFKESMRDVKSLANTKENFDKQLEKIAVHGNHIEDATRAMGVDPDSVPEGAGEEIDGAMKEMMGGQKTTSERNLEMQQKLGIVGQLFGDKKDKAGKEADTAEK
ncbi:hypothetical protein OKA04_18560 [Luteolibacter flavescens]|uniref:Uncharacterized protein n=1 Tax=Luteolibacter flavescens TaxID=1859460 RepID=A0ABT3FT45_9BACT|nr:hypothetical protein [Luteolibacter flavescens]MCW1886748.1 hypothetical protein [Luteolibacter flavescens]